MGRGLTYRRHAEFGLQGWYIPDFPGIGIFKRWRIYVYLRFQFHTVNTITDIPFRGFHQSKTGEKCGGRILKLPAMRERVRTDIYPVAVLDDRPILHGRKRKQFGTPVGVEYVKRIEGNVEYILLIQNRDLAVG